LFPTRANNYELIFVTIKRNQVVSNKETTYDPSLKPRSTSSEVFFDVENLMEASETAPTRTPRQRRARIGTRLATLAPGQTSGAARRNQAGEQSPDGASRATHEGMLRTPLAARGGEADRHSTWRATDRRNLPGTDFGLRLGGRPAGPRALRRAGNRGTAAGTRGPRRGNKPMGDTSGAALATVLSRNGLVSGARPRSRPLPRRASDPGTWKRVPREGATNSGAREGTDGPISVGSPRTSRHPGPPR
jgi:hypothetical protein